jgi:hypothetical protein
MKAVAKCLPAIVTCIALSWSGAAASASRAPSPRERASIRQVGYRTPHAGHSPVTVRNIRISTVGPWASATVVIYFGNMPDSAVDIFHYVNGRWRLASVGTAGEWCVMPRRDQLNLGFPASYPCHR